MTNNFFITTSFSSKVNLELEEVSQILIDTILKVDIENIKKEIIDLNKTIIYLNQEMFNKLIFTLEEKDLLPYELENIINFEGFYKSILIERIKNLYESEDYSSIVMKRNKQKIKEIAENYKELSILSKENIENFIYKIDSINGSNKELNNAFKNYILSILGDEIYDIKDNIKIKLLKEMSEKLKNKEKLKS